MKYTKNLFLYSSLILIALSASSIPSLVAHKTVEFHTGQTASFETFGGEDGDIDATPKSYTQDGCGAGTVVDNHTNLCWQRDDGNGANPWQVALDNCNATTTAGHTDWRLPTAYEAVTMLDYSCDATARPHCQSNFNNNALNWANGAASSYWTSTSRPDSTTVAYVIGSASGDYIGATKTNSNFVRCVRSAM